MNWLPEFSPEAVVKTFPPVWAVHTHSKGEREQRNDSVAGGRGERRCLGGVEKKVPGQHPPSGEGATGKDGLGQIGGRGLISSG